MSLELEKMRFSFRLAAMLALACLGCEEAAPLARPSSAVSNPSAAIASLRQAKENAENIVGTAKWELRRVRKSDQLTDGKRLYEAAEVSFNSVLSRIDAALGTNSEQTRREVAAALRDAEAKNSTFVNWYNSLQQRERLLSVRPKMTAASIDVLAEVIEFAINVYDAYAKLTAEQVTAFRQELNRCRWEKWKDIPRVDPRQ